MPFKESDLRQLLQGHSPAVRALVEELCHLVKSNAPQLSEEVKPGWNNITCKGQGIICAIQPYKKHVNFYFYKGTLLSDPKKILKGSGVQLRHFKVEKPADIQRDVIEPFLLQALDIDRSLLPP